MLLLLIHLVLDGGGVGFGTLPSLLPILGGGVGLGLGGKIILDLSLLNNFRTFEQQLKATTH